LYDRPGRRRGSWIFFVVLLLFLAQVAFQSDQDKFHAGAMFGDLAHPLRFDVLQGVLVVNL